MYTQDGRELRFTLGAHAPELSATDVERIHHVWLDAVKELGVGLHHRDVVSTAIAALEEDLHGPRREEVMDRLRKKTDESRV